MKTINEIIEQVAELHRDLIEIKNEKAVKDNHGIEELLKKYADKYVQISHLFHMHPMTKETKHRKKVYLRQLASLALAGKNVLQERQYAFIARVCNSISYEDKINDLFRDTLDNTESVFVEFCQEFNKKETLLLWCIDSSIMVGLAVDKKQMEVLAEIESIFGLTKTEVQFITTFAKAVLEQNQVSYEQALKFECPAVWKDSLEQYVLELGDSFVDGIVEDNDVICCYRGLKKEYTKIFLKDLYTCKTLRFKHVEFCFDKKVELDCKNLEIDDCKINGSDNAINLGKILKLDVNKSEFKNFENGVFDVESAANIVLTNNTFDDCCKNVGCELMPQRTYASKGKKGINDLIDKGEESYYWTLNDHVFIDYGIPVLESSDSGVALQVKNIKKDTHVNIANNVFNKCISNVPRGVVINLDGELELKGNIVISDNSFSACACKQDISEWKKLEDIIWKPKDSKWRWEEQMPDDVDVKREVALFYYNSGCIKKLVCESLVYLGEEHCETMRKSYHHLSGARELAHIEISKKIAALDIDNKNVDSNLSIFGDTNDTFVVYNDNSTARASEKSWEETK